MEPGSPFNLMMWVPAVWDDEEDRQWVMKQAPLIGLTPIGITALIFRMHNYYLFEMPVAHHVPGNSIVWGDVPTLVEASCGAWVMLVGAVTEEGIPRPPVFRWLPEIFTSELFVVCEDCAREIA